MYTDTQIAQMTLEHSKEIAALWESAKSAYKRIDENDRITASIHELAKNIAAITAEIRLLTERMDSTIERIEDGQKSQGQRIGCIEQAITTMKHNEDMLAKHEKWLERIQSEPAAKWKALVTQVIGLIVGAVFAMVMANIM